MSELGQDGAIVQCGREFTEGDLALIRWTVNQYSTLARKELVHTVCENLGWFTAAGGLKIDATVKLLGKLEERGLIKLPVKRGYRLTKKRAGKGGNTERSAPGAEVNGRLDEVRPVWLDMVTDKTEEGLWAEYMARYHYLGNKKPFGCPIRYFVRCDRGVLGCVLLAGAAKSIGVRDQWIGWPEEIRLRNLGWVANNTRFLIMPWVRVKNLASHVLGLMTRRLADDWESRWGYRPLLVETFVDPMRFQGTCYRAAGWEELGQTTGAGLRRPGREYSTTPKLIFVRPLEKDFRAQLCSARLRGSMQ